MVLVNYSGKEINAKVVYYGPGLCGKTTNLEFIYGRVPQTNRGKMVSMKTRTERTLFFDFLPLNLGELAGFQTRFLLYTVPGQIYYNATRKLVLKGVDALVFVADSGRDKMDENLESFDNLKDNLKEHGLSLDDIPLVLQYNKRDLPDVYTVEEMQQALNPRGEYEYCEAVATTGQGVFETFKGVARLLLAHLSKKMGVRQKTPATEKPEASEASPEVSPTAEAPAPTPVQGPAPAPAASQPSAAPADQPAWAPKPAQPVASSSAPPDAPEVEHTSAPAWSSQAPAQPSRTQAAPPQDAGQTSSPEPSPAQSTPSQWSPPTGAPGQIEMTAAPMSPSPGQTETQPQGSGIQIGAAAFPRGASPSSTPPPSASQPQAAAPPPAPQSVQQPPSTGAPPPASMAERSESVSPTLVPQPPAPQEPSPRAETSASASAPQIVPAAPQATAPGQPRVIQMPIQLEPQDLQSGVVLELHVVVRSQEGLLRRVS